MGKTKRNSNYNNFVDTDTNNLIVIKPRKIVEQVRTFEGEEGFVVPKNNTYLDKGLIININDYDETAIDVVGVSDSAYENAGGQINITANVTPNPTGIYVQISGGQTPYQSVTYTFGSGTGQQQGSSPNNSGSFGLNLNYNNANACYEGGSYTLTLNVTDSNGDTGTTTWSNYLQGTCSTGGGGQTPTPISGLTASATLLGTNDIKCSANWSNGTAPYSVKYTLYKIALIGNATTIVGNPIVQSVQGTNDSFTAQGLANGKYKFVVDVTDSNNNTLSATTSTITINQVSGSGGFPISNVTSNPISSLTANATLVSSNNIQCDANWSNGTAPYSVKYTLSKINFIGIPSVVGSPIIQNTSSTNNSFTAQNLADGKYKFEVVVTDSNNDTLTAISQLITILSGSGSSISTTPNPPLSGLNVNASLLIGDDIKCDASWSGGTAPFSVKYSFIKDGNVISTTPQTTSLSSDSFTAQTNSVAGNYRFQVEVTDANNDVKTELSQIITIQPNVVTQTTLPLSGLTINASVVGNNNNDLLCDVSWNNGTSPYSVAYYLYKDATLLGSIPPQSTTTNNNSYTATSLADGNYQYKVVVSDSQSSLSGISALINITNATQAQGQPNQNPPTTPPPTTPPPTTTPPPPTTGGGTILSGGGVRYIDKPIYLERETIIEAETFYSKNKFPIWLLIAIGVYLVASNKNN